MAQIKIYGARRHLDAGRAAICSLVSVSVLISSWTLSGRRAGTSIVSRASGAAFRNSGMFDARFAAVESWAVGRGLAVLERVKTPAHVVPGSNANKKTSSRTMPRPA